MHLNVQAFLGLREKKYFILPQHLCYIVMLIKIKSNKVHFFSKLRNDVCMIL